MTAVIPNLYPFRFDAIRHAYIDLSTGEERPHVTGMLERSGLVNDLWFTEESSERGTIVHKLTAEYDLGAIEDPRTVVSVHKGYLDAHVAAMAAVRPTFLAIEEPLMHPTYRYGGRLDRDALVFGSRAVWEVKAAVPQKSHDIQTALQAILLAPYAGLEPEMILRYIEYLKPNGKYKVEECKEMRDFDEARRLINIYCGEGRGEPWKEPIDRSHPELMSESSYQRRRHAAQRQRRGGR